VGRPAVLAGMTIATVILTAGCTGAQPTTTPPATIVTTPSTPTASQTGQTATSAMVHRVCSATVPAAVTSRIPAVTTTYRSDPFGPRCVWTSNDAQLRSASVTAVTPGDYNLWRQANSSITEQITVAGYPAYRGAVDGNCTVGVDINNTALAVSMVGVSDAGCVDATALASAVIGTH
jgi:Protein of unknown function (DUF3558)